MDREPSMAKAKNAKAATETRTKPKQRTGRKRKPYPRCWKECEATILVIQERMNKATTTPDSEREPGHAECFWFRKHVAPVSKKTRNYKFVFPSQRRNCAVLSKETLITKPMRMRLCQTTT